MTKSYIVIMKTQTEKSAFVGLAVMIILLPVPGYASKLIQGFQKRKMEKVGVSGLTSRPTY